MPGVMPGIYRKRTSGATGSLSQLSWAGSSAAEPRTPGQQHNNFRSPGEDGSLPGGQNSTVDATPQSIRQGSALAVTDVRKTDGWIDISLFYQEPQGRLRYSRCDTARPAGSNGTCWGTSTTLNSLAQNAGQLAVSLLVNGNRFNVCRSPSPTPNIGTNGVSVPRAKKKSANICRQTAPDRALLHRREVQAARN